MDRRQRKQYLHCIAWLARQLLRRRTICKTAKSFQPKTRQREASKWTKLHKLRHICSSYLKHMNTTNEQWTRSASDTEGEIHHSPRPPFPFSSFPFPSLVSSFLSFLSIFSSREVAAASLLARTAKRPASGGLGNTGAPQRIRAQPGRQTHFGSKSLIGAFNVANQ